MIIMIIMMVMMMITIIIITRVIDLECFGVQESAWIKFTEARTRAKRESVITDWNSIMFKGFVYVSMGSSVRASGMPDALREMFVAAFATLPYNVVWKWEGGKIEGLPSNVRTAAWWPQQELLGHPNLAAFVSHGGLLSLHEAAYHGSPTLVLPVFCDHDGNAAQAGMCTFHPPFVFFTAT